MKEMLKMTWNKQVEEEGMKVGLRRENTCCRSKWVAGISMIGNK